MSNEPAISMYDDNGTVTTEGLDYLRATSRWEPVINGAWRGCLDPGEQIYFAAWVAAGALPDHATCFRTAYLTTRA